MAKWEGFTEEDIKKVSDCERFVEGNIIKEFFKNIFVNDLLRAKSY